MEAGIICFPASVQYYPFFVTANSLALSYMVSFVFFMVVLIPERRRQKSINKYIVIYLTKITRLIDEILKVSEQFKDEEVRKIEGSPMLISIDSKDGKGHRYYTYREHFVKFYHAFHSEYDHLSHYIAFVDDELRECLFELSDCRFLFNIRELLIDNNSGNELFEENYSDESVEYICLKIKQFMSKGV